MDGDGIGLVLARASELQSKITNCIHRASNLRTEENKEREQEREGEDNGGRPQDKVGEAAKEVEEEEEAERLLNIRDAFESLEAQLSSLQVSSGSSVFLFSP